MKYYIEVKNSNKAKRDIDQILRNKQWHDLGFRKKSDNGAMRFFDKLCGLFFALIKLKKGDVIFLQYPYKKFYKITCLTAHLKGAKVVAVVHDLGAFRRHKLTEQEENKRLNATDCLIVHNEAMEEHLLKYGFKKPILNLGIFDYIVGVKPQEVQPAHTPWSIVYAGGLSRRRNTFLYNLNEDSMQTWQMELYGNGFNEEECHNRKIHYHGLRDSDDFVANIEGDFGLVWDGDNVDCCNGAWGEYLKINNPHKTSFYICAGLPVIVWSKAAMADFVRKNDVGIIVDGLEKIDEALAKVTPERYAEMRRNALSMSEKLREGYYIEKSISDAFKKLGV
jgi:glycosyltransferase involved in cell wall biosynthesis